IKVERLTALGEMATGVAHDFNNILSTVLGRTQLMRQKTHDKSILKNLAVIEQAANDGAATIRRIQGFSRVTTDHSYEELDLVQVVHDCIQMTRTRWKDEAEMRGTLYRVRRIFPDSLPVIGSMAELREVVTNLIMNALDAMPSGGELTFEGKAVNEEVVLTVSDTGSGMEENVVKRIFDPFFSTKKGEGTGLGLSVAYGIIARHNGRIECTSEPGEGTAFRIFLPRSREIGNTLSDTTPEDELDTSVVETDREAEEFSKTRSLKVLIIDDEQPIRDILSELLTQEGHEPLEAASGEKALQIIERENVDLVFTDLSMPGMNGWQVAERIHKNLPAVPIILTSGWGSDFNFDRLTQSGICHILPKPVPINAFMEIIERTMKGEPIRLDDEY
ncbi:MAG: hybrid sensor histidine kinase/response regulator, partial [Candidatus Sumerlaeota bacterium]